MASATKTGPQDLPPKGGYGPIQYDRIKLRSTVRGPLLVALFYGTTALGCYSYYVRYRTLKKEEIEMRSSRLAVTPMLLAQRDRAVLKQLRRIRDEENELMKNTPGWKTGTLFGEPIYETMPDDTLIEPSITEYVTHSDPSDFLFRLTRKWYT